MKKSSVKAQLMDTLPAVVNLPETSTDIVEIPKIAPIPVNKNTTESEVQDADLEVVNVAAIHIYKEWCKKNFSIKELSSLFKATVEFTKHRRKVLNMPYGAEAGSKGRRTIVYPLD